MQDFIWKLTGPSKAENPDPTSFIDWYGAAVTFVRATYREDLGKSSPAAVEGDKWEFVLTPKQPKLIDGSDAKEKKTERVYTGFNVGTTITDIPLCVYDLTGFEIGAGGARTPLVFHGAGMALADPYVTSVTIDYPPQSNGNGSPFYPQLTFDLQR